MMNRYTTKEVTIPISTTKYLDKLWQRAEIKQLRDLRLYPNVKEISESAAAFYHIRSIASRPVLEDPSTLVLIPGDGKAPKTGALFSLLGRCKNVISVDPLMNDKWVNGELKLENLSCYNSSITDWLKVFRGDFKTIIVVLVHSHVFLEYTIHDIERAFPHCRYIVYANDCCGMNQTIPNEIPIVETNDFGILSPERHIKIWNYL